MKLLKKLFLSLILTFAMFLCLLSDDKDLDYRDT